MPTKAITVKVQSNDSFSWSCSRQEGLKTKKILVVWTVEPTLNKRFVPKTTLPFVPLPPN